MNFTSFRLKIRHWYRNNKGIILIIIIVWSGIFLVNKFLGDYTPQEAPNTTRTPRVSVLDDSSTVPSKIQVLAENMIEEYVGYCNDGNYQKAFNMLSKDCQKYEFDNDLQNFAKYVLTKIPTPKNYSIQDYSNYDGYYIYEVKYIDDILKTGLMNSIYSFSTEKIAFKKNSDGGYDMSAGNFIRHDNINSISENEYVKIDIVDRIVNYSIEQYNVKFTNRTDSTVVIKDDIESSEINLVLSQEYRPENTIDKKIILEPGEQQSVTLTFTKFSDDMDSSTGILFSSIRVIENYKGELGTKEEQKQEIDTALAKFSMQVPVK